MSALPGCWEIAAEENNTSAEVLRQNGHALITRETPDALDIRKTFNVTVATGLYAPLLQASPRRSGERWRLENNMLSIESQSATPNRAGLSPDRRETFRTFMFYHARREITLFGEERLRIESPDRVNVDTRIRDVFGAYHETYTEHWRRVAPAECAGLD
ncbi:hypothetical protein U91I_02697 [alpha proteobacterium U9-1i]|nr:hypothetical protein U91I_02697 [alpha proteobacterium U9-1i]